MAERFYIYDEEIRLQNDDDDLLQISQEESGVVVVDIVSAGMELSESHRRHLIKWLASRTPGLHLIECEHAAQGGDRG